MIGSVQPLYNVYSIYLLSLYLIDTDNFSNSLVSGTKLVKYVAVVFHAIADVVGI